MAISAAPSRAAWTQMGGGGAAGAQDHQLLSPDFHAVLPEVADKADAVGVVAGEAAILPLL